ncbi:MAG: ABC transporter [Zestosphaera tikiterensis]|uniref:ABC transporter n=1 Tax=Zestosphaera tikiterensis TaxID=1973259 RepID=A0A2R7Y902_9CREN|nr:MAG: ABC transporter [Zestosphaera tikiterensis]
MLLEILRYASKALTEKRFRAVLTIIGIAIGPLALTMMTSTVRGYADYVQQQILSLGQNTVVVMPTERYQLTQSDLDFIKSLDEVEDAQPFFSLQGFITTPEGRKGVFIYAIDSSILLKAVGNLELESGDFPSESETAYAVIGNAVAYTSNKEVKLYDLGDAITVNIPQVKSGGQVALKRVSFRVKGILKEFGGAFFVSPDQSVFLPLKSGKTVLGEDKWSGIFVVVKDPVLVESTVSKLRSVYQDRLTIVAFQQIARIVASITGAMDFITFATSLSAFAVAVAGTAATMITSVIERTREIGVLKAIGFTDASVVLMILAESLIMSLIGGAIGITTGVLGAHVLASRGLTISASATTNIVIQASPKITLENLASTIAITIFVGVAGGIMPAYRAAKIPPAVALRYE